MQTVGWVGVRFVTDAIRAAPPNAVTPPSSVSNQYPAAAEREDDPDPTSCDPAPVAGASRVGKPISDNAARQANQRATNPVRLGTFSMAARTSGTRW
jgi:hypothetical protein